MSIIPLGTQALNYPDIESVMKGYEKKVNEQGGINGHPLQVIICNDKRDPNTAAACARQAVDDKVAAVVGSASQYGSSILPVLAQAKIASIGLPYGPDDYTSPVSFPIGRITFGVFRAFGTFLGQKGDKNVGLALLDVPNAKPNGDEVGTGLKATGGSIAKQVLIPFGAADAAPYAAALRNTDAVAIITDQPNQDKLIKALHDANYKGDIVTSTLTDDEIKQLGSAVEGVYQLDSAPPLNRDDSAVADYFTFLDKYAPKTDPINSSDFSAYQGMQVFEKVASGMSTIDGPSFLAALEKSSSVDIGVFPKPLDFTKAQGPSESPRIFNPYVFISQVKDGTLKLADPKPIEPFGTGS